MLCFSLEYVTFLTVTPNMTSVHIVNRRPLFTHLGETTEEPFLPLATMFLVSEMPLLLTPLQGGRDPNYPDPIESCCIHS